MKRVFVFGVLFISFLAYSLIVYTHGTKQDLYANEMAIKGKLLFQEHNCISCHQLYGLGGYLGADLTNIISAKGKGEEFARTFIKYGTGIMPVYNFDSGEIDNLIEYLKYVDQSATTYKSKNATTHL